MSKKKDKKDKLEKGKHESVVASILAPIRLDFGCGPNPRVDRDPAGNLIKEFEGVDVLPFDGKVKHVLDASKGNWPWEDSTIDEANAAHFIEHLTNLNDKWERCTFFNELWRVLKPGAQCNIVIPYWCSNRYYGDPTHKEPFSEMGFFYLLKDWRLAQAPHTDAEVTGNPKLYKCNFDAVWGYSPHPQIALKHQEAQQHAFTFYKEAAQDLVATITAKK